MERPGHAPSREGVANFDNVRCAALHNELVARRIAINANISQYFVRNVLEIPGIPETHPDYPDTAIRDFLSEDLITFLESIDSLVPQHPYRLGLTPFVTTPDVTTFWSFSDHDPQDEYPYAILLYQDLQSSTRGGLFFDQNTNLACWVTLPGRWPAAEDWIPLEQILQRWLRVWESGKIQAISGGDHHELVLRPWSESDLERTMRSWERLLQAVESRLQNHRVPPQSSPVGTHLVSREVVDRYLCHSFARAFLSTARAPRVPQLRVAPEIATFTDEA
jgi:hypothetical protein